MNSLTNQQLLRDYAQRRSEAAFAEIVRRHIDLVYCAALRMVQDAHLAEDVTQGAFVALARQAHQLADCPVLSGWLHRTAQDLAANAVRSDVRSRAREQKAAAMNELLANESDATWENIASYLDVALEELNVADRDILLLRFFELKSAREMAQILEVSEEAAQKRVSRAIERLRECFSKRNVTIGAGGLAVLISANAVESAPVGLAASISTAIALAGKTVATTTTATIKTMAMTSLQKTIVGAALATAIGTGVYEAHKISRLQHEFAKLQRQQTLLVAQTQRAADQTAAKLAALDDEKSQLKSATDELAQLRNEFQRQHGGTRSVAAAHLPREPRPQNTAPSDTQTGLEIPKSSWGDVGFSSPKDALRTRGRAVLTGNRVLFKQSLFVTDNARKTLEDWIVQRAKASTDPNKARYIRQILNNHYGVADGILMPMRALNEKEGFTGYRILSEQAPSANEKILEMETDFASAPPQKQTLKFRQIDGEWKVVIDRDFIDSMR